MIKVVIDTNVVVAANLVDEGPSAPTSQFPEALLAACAKRTINRSTVVSQSDTITVEGGLSKHDRTLEAIFAVSTNVLWTDVVAMLKHYKADLSDGRGSRVRIHLNGVRAVFHRPHPQKETDRGAVAAMKRFLVEAGIHPQRKGKKQ